MASETTTPMSLDAALALLPLPDADGLPEGRRRGAECVWTGAPLNTEMAIDLGERSASDGTSWWPRASPAGVLREATYTLHEHTTMCEQCVDDAPRCEVGAALLRVVREMRRP